MALVNAPPPALGTSLDALGLKLSDPVTALFQKMGERFPRMQEACQRCGESLEDDFLVVSIASMFSMDRKGWCDAVTQEGVGGKATWASTFETVCGMQFDNKLGRVPESAACFTEGGTVFQGEKQERFPRGAKIASWLLSQNRLHELTLDKQRLTECFLETRDPAKMVVSRNDKKAVTNEVYDMVFEDWGAVRSDVNLFNHLEDEIEEVAPHPGRVPWCQSLRYTWSARRRHI